jgi:hypothetical protein
MVFEYTCINRFVYKIYIVYMPIPVVMQSNAKVCGRSIAGIAASNPTQDMDARLLCLLCIVCVAASATC